MTPSVSYLPRLVIPADTADAVLATTWCERPFCIVGPLDHHDPTPWRGDPECPSCAGTQRVPAPDALRRLTFPDRPTVPCPLTRNVGMGQEEALCETYLPEGVKLLGGPCEGCARSGVVPLVGGMTVELAVEEHRIRSITTPWTGWEPCRDESPDDPLHERRQRVVAVAQVADVIPVVAPDSTPERHLFSFVEGDGRIRLFDAEASGDAVPHVYERTDWLSDGQDYSPGRWVVVLSRVDSVAPEETP